MADYDWFDHEDSTQASIDAAKYRPLGFTAVFENASTMGGQPLRIRYYLCRRGCGTLVWSPETHMKNVCIEFNPIAG